MECLLNRYVRGPLAAVGVSQSVSQWWKETLVISNTSIIHLNLTEDFIDINTSFSRCFHSSKGRVTRFAHDQLEKHS